MNVTAADPVHDAARPYRRPGVKLTRRGRRLGVVVVLAGTLVGAMASSQTRSIATGETRTPRAYSYVVVQPGQTLWEIARSVAPGTDPRVTISRIRDVNALPGVDIQAGQRIALP